MSHCYSGYAFFESKYKMETKKHRLLALALISSFTLMGAELLYNIQMEEYGHTEKAQEEDGLFQITTMVKNTIIHPS